jgi:hypothetical protein
MKFNKDWTGVFIRGDSAFDYAEHLRMMIDALPETVDLADAIRKSKMESLLELLESSMEPTTGPVQRMQEFENCK